MSSKFFTNAEGNTLLQKIQGVFEHKKVHFLDVLVGFLHASGYFRVRPFIAKAQKIRLLVGISVDHLIAEATTQGLQLTASDDQIRGELLKALIEDVQKADYKPEIEQGMVGLLEDISSEKVQLRVHPNRNLHAKIYIFREEHKHAHGYGAVITGSSNLTAAGLEKNFEFNVELRDDEEIEFAANTFEKLWGEGVPVTSAFAQELKQQTYLNDAFTPFDLYVKFLLEYFGSAIEFDPDSILDLPKGFKKLSYQVDAVNDGFTKLQQHNGFFLADVVGLGKTIIATLIARKFYYSNGFPSYQSHTLIVVPPALEEGWRQTVDKFNLNNVHFETVGSLHKITNARKYDLILVDEAHKFRSDTADMYRELQRICKTPTRQGLDKKVILISATPLNNRPQDIANLVYLFQDSKDSTLDVANLQHFFAPLIKEYERLKRDGTPKEVQEGVRKIYESIRETVIVPLTVRRTRKDIEAHPIYRDDIKRQGISFPKVRPPHRIYYPLDVKLEELYDRTFQAISGVNGGLTYYRYQAIAYLKPEKRARYQSALLISQQLARIMKTMLIKRLDSSFHAFRSSLKRFQDATQVMVNMFDKGAVYIAPNLPVNEFLLEDKEDELIKLIEEASLTDPTIQVVQPSDFEDAFLPGLKADLQLLSDLYAEWEAVDSDPKLDAFLLCLKDDLRQKTINPSGKLIVFSESKETSEYLAKQLEERGFGKLLNVSSHNRKERLPLVKANFDANLSLDQQANDYDILISTEVLAEGINLHRANVIINYDTPWNSTRLMQRIGRVNRIGTTADAIHIFNFFPTAKVEEDIELERKAKLKLHAFHVALGEDSQIYSEEEAPATFGLFDKLLEEEQDRRLDYLMWLREFREKNPNRFKQVKNLPRRARTGRQHKGFVGSSYVYVRSQRRDGFYFVSPDETVQEATFLAMADALKATPEEVSHPLPPEHHLHVSSSVEHFHSTWQQQMALDKKVEVQPGPTESNALYFLSALLRFPLSSPVEQQQFAAAQTAIKAGRFQNLARDLNKLRKSNDKAPVAMALLIEKAYKLCQGFPLLEEVEVTPSTPSHPAAVAQPPEIILSESFVG
ncbi:MAG: helicase-related protein [Methylacidiphilales bacterium]|nr:helicase-related protein [Candidatus Methylacidiphilales bacterium]